VLFTAGSKGDEPGSTVTLLQNLLVLSVGGSVGRADEEPKDVFGRGSSVTLGATVEQAQIVTNAKDRGRLTLTLRNSNDITLVEATSAPLDKNPSTLTGRTDANRALLGRAQEVERAH